MDEGNAKEGTRSMSGEETIPRQVGGQSWCFPGVGAAVR